MLKSKNSRLFLGTLIVIGVTFITSVAYVQTNANSGNAQRLKAGIQSAKGTVDRIIASVNNPGNPGNPDTPDYPDYPDYPDTPDYPDDPWVWYENDLTALPILMSASSTLGNAGALSDQAKLAYLSGNFALGNFRYAQACSSLGIARSQVARANTAALLPPVGFLAAFGPDLANVVIELQLLRASEGCP